MALYKGYVEANVVGGPVRRYLLDLDLSVLAAGGDPLLNHIDLDGADPRPDMTVRITPVSITAADTHLQVELKPYEGRVLLGVEARVFINSDTVPGQPVPPLVYPVDGAFPRPSHWVYVSYLGAAGQRMPDVLTIDLSQRTLRADGAPEDAPLTDESIDIVVRSPSVDGPLHVEGGLLEGDLDLVAAREPLLGPTWADGPEVDVRGIALTAEVATLADVTIATPSSTTFPLECLWVGVGSDHVVDPPPAPTVAPAAGAGTVGSGTHRYRCSYVLANGNETRVGPPSEPVTVATDAGGQVDVTVPTGPPPPAPPAEPDPGLEVVARRLYRTVASATGDAGEYLLAGVVADNTTTAVTDGVDDGTHDLDRRDDELVEPPAHRLVVHYSSVLRHDVAGSLTLREPGHEDRYLARIDNAPTEARVTYRLRPPPGRPRVRWQASGVVDHAEVTVPTLVSGLYRWCEARLDGVPQALGGHWFLRGDDQLLVEVGGGTRGEPLTRALGRGAVVLSSAPREWRDAPQAVCAELVETWFAPGALEKARVRLSVSGLRQARFDLGLTEGGTARHARPHEGVVLDVELAPPASGPMTHLFPRRPGRALRTLYLTRTFDDAGARSASHTALRVGDLPDTTHLDLRLSNADAEGGEYAGAHLTGRFARVKVLSLTDPAPGAAAWAADALRLWVTVPATADELDVVRTPDGTAVALLPADGPPLAAEASVRNPLGLTSAGDGADEPFRHVKGLLTIPANLRVGPGALAFGRAGPGTGAETLLDPQVVFDPGWFGGAVRYLSGGQAGVARRVTDVANDGSSITTEAFPTFPAAPGEGDEYLLEAYAPTTPGLSFATPLDGPGVTGRVGVTRDLDSFLAAPATPQARIRTAPVGTAPEPTLRSVTLRAYGVRAGGAASEADGQLSLPLRLDPQRVNRAFRAELRALDPRIDTAERDVVRARLEAVPDEPTLRVNLERDRFEWRAEARSGPVVFVAEPSLMRGPAAGPRASTPAGIGFVEGSVDGLPRWVRATLLPSIAVAASELVPRNFTPPAGMPTTGVKAEVSEMASIDFLRFITWSRDHRGDLNKVFWSQAAATFVRWEQQGAPAPPAPPVLQPVWVWLFGEDNPADEDEPQSGVGFRIPALDGGTPGGVSVTLDLDQSGLTTNQAFARARDLAGFDVAQELQMQGFTGEVTVSSTAGGIAGGDAAGNDGQWFLRIVDGLPWYVGWGSAYFGNTGPGSPFTLPRIFA